MAYSGAFRTGNAFAVLARGTARQFSRGWASLLVARHPAFPWDREVAALVTSAIPFSFDAAVRCPFCLSPLLLSRSLPTSWSLGYLRLAPSGPGARRRLDVVLGNVCVRDSSGRYHHPAPWHGCQLGRQRSS